MFSGDVIDLDQAGTLAVVEAVLRVRREAEVAELRAVLHWADLHAGDPRAEPDAVPVRWGGDRLVRLGGAGTPAVSEFCWAELAVARRAGVVATRNLAADALDLRHRLPAVWAKVASGVLEVWVARKAATMTRSLSVEAVALVDAAVAVADELAPGRWLALVEAKVIEADLEAHRARVERDATRTGVWFQRRRPGDVLGGQAGAAEAATRGVVARLGLGASVDLEAMIEEIADVLAMQDDCQALTRDRLRAEALALMAFPGKVIALLEGSAPVVEEAGHGRHETRSAVVVEEAGHGRHETRPAVVVEEAGHGRHETRPAVVVEEAGHGRHETRPAAVVEEAGHGRHETRSAAVVEEAGHGRHETRRPSAVLYLHISAAALSGVPTVARCDRLGPLLLEQVRDLLQHRRVRVQPVIDLNTVQAVDAYEHPTAVKRRTVLRTGGDVFPHSTGSVRRLDHDHVVPYDPLGPPGQTGDLNDAPLTRFHHRVKTHARGWRVEQLGLGAYRWVSPHALARVVTPRGTRVMEPLRDENGRVVGELYPDPGLTLTLDLP
jgi:hypothetical protein